MEITTEHNNDVSENLICKVCGSPSKPFSQVLRGESVTCIKSGHTMLVPKLYSLGSKINNKSRETKHNGPICASIEEKMVLRDEFIRLTATETGPVRALADRIGVSESLICHLRKGRLESISAKRMQGMIDKLKEKTL